MFWLTDGTMLVDMLGDYRSLSDRCTLDWNPGSRPTRTLVTRSSSAR